MKPSAGSEGWASRLEVCLVLGVLEDLLDRSEWPWDSAASSYVDELVSLEEQLR